MVYNFIACGMVELRLVPLKAETNLSCLISKKLDNLRPSVRVANGGGGGGGRGDYVK